MNETTHQNCEAESVGEHDRFQHRKGEVGVVFAIFRFWRSEDWCADDARTPPKSKYRRPDPSPDTDADSP